MSALVGVLGGGGAIGMETVAFLLRHVPDLEVLALGRSPDRLAGVRERHGKGVRTRTLDCSDAPALGEALGQCDVVCNCAGPSSVLGPRVAGEVLRAGVPYVDPAGEAALLAVFERPHAPAARASVVLGAGLVPGLSGIVPLWLQQVVVDGGDRPWERMRVYYAAMDTFSLTAAYDYADSIRKAPPPEATAARPHFVEMPFSGHTFLAFAHTSAEIRRVCASSGISLAFHNCFIGEEMPRALAAVADTRRAPLSMDEAALVLRDASRACASRYGQGHFLLCQARRADGQSASLAVAVEDANALMGAMVGLAVEAVLGGRTQGVRYFAEALPARHVMRRLAGYGLLRMKPSATSGTPTAREKEA
ncbi:MAG TPA: saccharopine dehydrogenase NADP-binding domain-containing protein [Solidesulfovibrio sp.]|nr:saccharopine dehydrogenase NADP-binding domain-containing protein [Solidesulfovibrio sp.]